jgi:hypothetical protein
MVEIAGGILLALFIVTHAEAIGAFFIHAAWPLLKGIAIVVAAAAFLLGFFAERDTSLHGFTLTILVLAAAAAGLGLCIAADHYLKRRLPRTSPFVVVLLASSAFVALFG